MYKGQSGMWSWLFHRISGLGILLFLLIHIVDISLLGFGPKVYNEGIALFGTGIVRIISLALIGGLALSRFQWRAHHADRLLAEGRALPASDVRDRDGADRPVLSCRWPILSSRPFLAGPTGNTATRDVMRTAVEK